MSKVLKLIHTVCYILCVSSTVWNGTENEYNNDILRDLSFIIVALYPDVSTKWPRCYFNYWKQPVKNPKYN